MTEPTPGPGIDTAAAHRHFSAHCFNGAWDLIDKADRSPADDEQMVRLAQASLWHWSQRPDCTPRNLSIGTWQLSRIYALLGQPDNARRYGGLSLEHAPGDDAFCRGYAHEALARAEAVAGNAAKQAKHVAAARRCAEAVADEEERQMLESDLDALGAAGGCGRVRDATVP